MSHPTIRVLTLIFGIGKFEDDDDYQRIFIAKPSPIMFPTAFVPDDETKEQKLNLELTIDLSDIPLFNRFNAVDMTHPWEDKDAFIKVILNGSVDVNGNVIVEHNVVSTPGALIYEDHRIGLVSWQLSAQTSPDLRRTK